MGLTEGSGRNHVPESNLPRPQVAEASEEAAEITGIQSKNFFEVMKETG